MKFNLIIGMVAGSLIGATAALIALPYIQPELSGFMRKSKKAINKKLDDMENIIS